MSREEFIEKYNGFLDTSLDVGDGWLPLIDKLVSMIKNVLDTKIKYNEVWLEKKTITEIEYTKNKALIDNFKIVQIKEKFGGLRFYVDGANEQINAWIQFAEVMSYDMCEECGSNKNIGRTKGWVRTICGDCSVKIGKQDVWLSKEDQKKLMEGRVNKYTSK